MCVSLIRTSFPLVALSQLECFPFGLPGGFGTITDSWIKDKSPENCLASVEIYDPQANTWAAGLDLPIPLCAMGVVKYCGTIYILGEYRRIWRC